MTVFGHFSAGYIGYAAQRACRPRVAGPASGVIAILGGLSITLGYKAKIGGWLNRAVSRAVTLALHNFWAVTDPMMRGCRSRCS